MYFENIVTEHSNEDQTKITVAQIFANDDPNDDDTLMSQFQKYYNNCKLYFRYKNPKQETEKNLGYIQK